MAMIIGASELRDHGLPYPYLRCLHFVSAELVAIVCGNGVTQYKLLSQACGEKSGAIAYKCLPEEWLPRARILSVSAPTPTLPCARCGSTKPTQYHHWAPQVLFTDAHEWPGSHLCQACHTRWHQVMTPTEFYRVLKKRPAA